MIPARPTRRSAGTGLVCATRSDPQLFSFLGWVRLLEPVTPGELAAETGMPATTIRDHLRRLTERCHIARAPNPADGRSYLVKPMAQGRRVMDRGRPLVGAVFERVEPYLARPAAEYVERSRELGQALASARPTAERRHAALRSPARAARSSCGRPRSHARRRAC